jgi:hypothetical protein
MRANQTEYLFSVNTNTPTTMTVDSGEEFTVEVRGAFDDVEDISAVPKPFTPACDSHPLAPITGPMIVRGAKPRPRGVAAAEGGHIIMGQGAVPIARNGVVEGACGVTAAPQDEDGSRAGVSYSGTRMPA